MLLLIDSGNTNVVFGLYNPDQGQVLKAFRTTNEPERTADEYMVWLSALMQINGFNYRTIQHVAIGSVVPEAEFNLISLARRYFNVEPLVVGQPGLDLGLDVLVENPKEVGADRLLNALAAHAHYGGPLIIIDFGTATTFDVVDRNGSYCGGAIAPGIHLSLRSLYMAAAKLPLVEIAPPSSTCGKNTQDAMQSGVFFGYISMIEGMTARLKSEMGLKKNESVKIIATGGLCELFANHTPAIDHTNRSLTLNGLALLYERNRGFAGPDFPKDQTS